MLINGLLTSATLVFGRQKECGTPVKADPLNSFLSDFSSLSEDEDGTTSVLYSTRLSYASSPSNGSVSDALDIFFPTQSTLS